MESSGCPSDGTLCWKDTWFHFSVGYWSKASFWRREVTSLGCYPSLLTTGLTTSSFDGNCNENDQKNLKPLVGRFKFVQSKFKQHSLWEKCLHLLITWGYAFLRSEVHEAACDTSWCCLAHMASSGSQVTGAGGSVRGRKEIVDGGGTKGLSGNGEIWQEHRKSCPIPWDSRLLFYPLCHPGFRFEVPFVRKDTLIIIW